MKYGSYGFIAISLYSENTSSSTPTQADLAAWGSFYSASYPLLSDPKGATDRVYDPTGAHRPTYVLLGPGAEILAIGSSYSTAAIEAALPTPYP